jgi:hypothetical protein
MNAKCTEDVKDGGNAMFDQKIEQKFMSVVKASEPMIDPVLAGGADIEAYEKNTPYELPVMGFTELIVVAAPLTRNFTPHKMKIKNIRIVPGSLFVYFLFIRIPTVKVLCCNERFD